MPPAVPIIAAIAAVAAPAAAAIVFTPLVASIVGAVVSVGLGFLAQAITPDNDFGPPAADFASEAARRTHSIRSTVAARRIVVGEAKVGGTI